MACNSFQFINQAKNRFEENGFAFILWGALTAFCCFSQAYLIHIGLGAQSWYPYLIMPLATIFTVVYYSKSSNPLNVISSRLWMFTGFNIMILAFGFSVELRSILSTIILLLLGIATAVAGNFIRSRMLLISGIILNLTKRLCSLFCSMETTPSFNGDGFHGYFFTSRSIITLQTQKTTCIKT